MDMIDFEENNQVQFPLKSGIPKSQVVQTKVDLEYVICPICFNIIWQPISCSQEKCYTSFCSLCINRWIQSNDQSDDNNSDIDEEEEDPANNFEFQGARNKSCPKCRRKFKPTTLPLINSLLSTISFYCLNKEGGCEEQISYDMFHKHCMQCPFKKINCEGCQQELLLKDYPLHQETCEKILVKCSKCYVQLPRQQFQEQHQIMECMSNQMQQKDSQIHSLSLEVESLKEKYSSMEQKLEMIIRGEKENLHTFEFSTVFQQNFQFGYKEARLIQSSWNSFKNKYDFLHFYLRKGIKTQGALGVQWKMKIIQLKGSLLIGICSTLCHHSVDYILNKYGEIKKKESNDNKYKPIRKVNFSFNEFDTLIFTYQPFQQLLKIENESKNVYCCFEQTEIQEMGGQFYNFFSLDKEEDHLKFL